MSNQSHRIRGAWPLYLVIAIAGASSLATSAPPTWQVQRFYDGPTAALDPEQREQSIPFTIRFSPEYDWSDIELYGVVEHEDADEQFRVSIVEPGKRTLATQFQEARGNGRFLITLESLYTSLRCETEGADPCEQDLAIVFGTGGARTGTYVVDWYIAVRTGGDGTDPPKDLIFSAEMEGGREIARYRDLTGFDRPPDPPGNNRWQLVSEAQANLVVGDPSSPASQHFVVRAAGPYDASELFIPMWIYYDGISPEISSDIRVTVIPDQPGAGAGTEHVATASGNGNLIASLSLYDALDCLGEPACERGFTISIDADGESFTSVSLLADVYAIIRGDGDMPPADASVQILYDVAAAQRQDD